MIITSRDEKFYRIEMTAMQAHHLSVFLELGRGGHIDELKVSANCGAQLADDINETLISLRDTLESR